METYTLYNTETKEKRLITLQDASFISNLNPIRLKNMLASQRTFQIGSNLVSAGDIDVGQSILFSGYILNNGNSEIISRGFKYGSSSNNLSNTIVSEDSTDTFTVQVITSVPVYYRAYAENITGIGLGEIRQLT
jgi:hypothetical protein